ncbi:MAG: hypothetical protein HFG42_11180 [Lachnospiraceae bacterium]|jgi:hypothetical protein|nr:hypothetical protein [Lachnospiraceae bacterium]
MSELREEWLARHRVDDGNGGHKAVEMTREERAFRRSFIRSVLLRKSRRFRNLPNDELDQIRLFRVGDQYVLEDRELYEHVIGRIGK